MSDKMMLGILRMDMPNDNDPTGRLQYEANARLAADEIERLRATADERPIDKFVVGETCVISVGKPILSDGRVSEMMIEAFVQGAKWWCWEQNAATMWQSDQKLAEEKARAMLESGRLGITTEEYLATLEDAEEAEDEGIT